MNEGERRQLNLQAHCACGAVELAFDGLVKSMFLCACEDCQKATGTGHAAVILMPAASLATIGVIKSFSRPAASGATFTRSFCPECGTPLFGQSSRAPDLVMIPAGLLGGQARWFRPKHMIFSRDHQPWDLVASDLPRHETYGQGRQSTRAPSSK